RKCGSICACSASIRASSTVRSSCSVSARFVSALAVSSALRFPPAIALTMNAAMISENTSTGCLKIPPTRIRLRNETSSSIHHDTIASQSTKPHHMATTPLRISRTACLVVVDRGVLAPALRFAASSAGVRMGLVVIAGPSWRCLDQVARVRDVVRRAPQRRDAQRGGGDEPQETAPFRQFRRARGHWNRCEDTDYYSLARAISKAGILERRALRAHGIRTRRLQWI